MDQKEIKGIVDGILSDYDQSRDIDKMEFYNRPAKRDVIDLMDKLLVILYPGYFRERVYRVYDEKASMIAVIEDAFYRLNQLLTLVLPYDEQYKTQCRSIIELHASEIAREFFKKIPVIREYLDTDLQAILDGDPAASNKDEIILCYPGFYAISINRLAHELYLLKVPMLPRMMSEHAHSLTGIDIHPGATIGKYFCIDHGTGIVVGETCVIGEHVKLYQGVTLGALSTRGGQALRGTHRHPTIRDYVTIYSNASILGGNTVIGKGSVIGGNVFITQSLPENTRVSVKGQELHIKNDIGVFSNFEEITDDPTMWI